VKKNLYDSYLWALSPEARKAVKELEEAGYDPDLAMSLLETLVPEQAIYKLDEDEADE
jgi:hypothetical protein